MKKNKLTWVITAFLGISFIGAGCATSVPDIEDLPRTTPVDLEAFEPAERTMHVNFVSGSIIQIESAFTGFQDNVDLNQDKQANTVIVIDRFAPQTVANMTWNRLVDLKDENGEAISQRLTANLIGINLNDSPQFWLPAFWPEEEGASSRGTSGLWISRERFEGLYRNRISTLNTSLLDIGSYGALGEDPNVRILLERLSAEVQRVSGRIDANLSKAEKDPVKVSLLVNEKMLDIEALKVTNWYGEFLVLNNPQNPLILSFSFQDKNEDGTPRFKGANLLKKLLDYHVTALKDVLS
ncbi:MAG: hypothetical protein NUV91_05890 [Candidatus Omnitrophica bacterium]|nr:hypothetical protein [Candidatus Omnitrophota bacterium]